MLVAWDHVKREGGNQLEEESSTLQIIYGYRTVRDLWSIFILGQSQEMEWDVDNEEGRAHILDLKDKIVANIEGDGSEVHRWEARVDDDYEHDTVPEIQEGALCV